LEEGKSIPLY